MTEKPTYEELRARVDQLEESLRSLQLARVSSSATVRLSEEIERRMAAEEHLRAIWENTDTAIVIIDAETHEIIDSNPFACRLIGRPNEEVIGRICHDFICPACAGQCPITDLHQKVDNSEKTLLTGSGEIAILKTVVPVEIRRRKCLIESFIEITSLKRAEEARELLIRELEGKIAEVNTLSGLLPICSVCKKVRDDSGYWNQIEGYIAKRSNLDFSHSICPDCAKEMYPDIKIYDD